MPNMDNVDAPEVPDEPTFHSDWTFRDFRLIALEMSLREVASHTVSYKTIRRIEHGESQPTMKTHRKLANDLNLTVPEVGVLIENSREENINNE